MENRLNEISKLLENKCGSVQMNDWRLEKPMKIVQSESECKEEEEKNDLENI